MTLQTSDYQILANRSTNIGGYRYFFNGQEADNEVFGEVANFGYEFRQYDSRLGRWWSVDPKWNEYPSVSPYVFCNGSPVILMDLKGMEYGYPPFSQILLQNAAKIVVYIIQQQAIMNNTQVNTNTNWTIHGQYHTTKEGQKTDTQTSSADEFNMYVNYEKVFHVDESDASAYQDYEAFVVAYLMTSFASGTGPENYDFPENGIISSKMLNSSVVQKALADYKKSGENVSRQYTFGLIELAWNTFNNNYNVFNIEGLVGSANVSITSTDNNMLSITIFNITSLTSGAYFKDICTGTELYPKSIMRDSNQKTPYGNISQTFHLLIPND